MESPFLHPPLEGGSKNSKNFSGRGAVDGIPRPEVFFSLTLKESLRPSLKGRMGFSSGEVAFR